MQQLALIHEDFDSALMACVQALGGAKVVGVMLRPEYESDPDKAARWLLACLNSQRDEKLSWQQTFMIMRKARDMGVHVAMAYIAQTIGYADPQPIDPDDEKAALMRQFIAATKTMQALTSRMDNAGLRAVA